jgi:hypothetical protein
MDFPSCPRGRHVSRRRRVCMRRRSRVRSPKVRWRVRVWHRRAGPPHADGMKIVRPIDVIGAQVRRRPLRRCPNPAQWRSSATRDSARRACALREGRGNGPDRVDRIERAVYKRDHPGLPGYDRESLQDEFGHSPETSGLLVDRTADDQVLARLASLDDRRWARPYVFSMRQTTSHRQGTALPDRNAPLGCKAGGGWRAVPRVPLLSHVRRNAARPAPWGGRVVEADDERHVAIRQLDACLTIRRTSASGMPAARVIAVIDQPSSWAGGSPRTSRAPRDRAARSQRKRPRFPGPSE